MEIQDLFKSRKDITQLPEQFNDAVYSTAASGVQTASKGFFSMLTTGFGMGVVATVAAFVIAAPLLTGLASAAGMVTFSSIPGIIEVAGFADGIGLGLKTLGSFVLQAPGIASAVLAVGGLLGATINAYRSKEQNSAEAALAQAKMFEALRQRQPEIAPGLAPEAARPKEDLISPAPEPVRSPTTVAVPDGEKGPILREDVAKAGFCDREMSRRSANLDKGIEGGRC